MGSERKEVSGRNDAGVGARFGRRLTDLAEFEEKRRKYGR